MSGTEVFVAPIIAAALGIYNPCKDLFLFVMGRRRDIKALEERMSELINLLVLITSEKEKMDTALGNSVLTKESQAYPSSKAEIAVITKKYVEFIDKYAKSTTNQLTSTTELNNSTASLMIDQLSHLKSKVMTTKFFKLAKLSRDVAKLSKRASGVIAKFKPEYVTQKCELVQDKFFGGADAGDNILPVFDTYVDEVLEHLREGAKAVGILGRKGAGKTTVLRKLHDRLLGQRSEWGKIIWIEYPAPETETETDKVIEMLQKEIVPQLNIHDYREATNSVNQNSNIISTFLHHRKYILLMDEVTASVDLEKLGLRENHDHRKVVICSRESDVIKKMTENEVKIEGLTKGDAWELFRTIYGEELYDSNRRSIVDSMMECCGWTAGMVRCIACHLKNQKASSYSWDYDKQILQSESKSHGFFDLGDFDKAYEMAYLGLEMDARRCLLYGALFPYRHKICADYLVECWIAEGLINERVDKKVRHNRQIGQKLLNHLTGVYLLEWYANTSEKYVTMSSDFRRVAFNREYTRDEECLFWVPSKDRTPNRDDWKTVTRMSLIGCRLRLPDTPECDSICTLLLQCLKPNLEHLAPTFFSHMKSLQVLDLSHTEIGALPESINELTDLKGLYLNGCLHLDALPDGADKLVKIEFLDISGTSISTLPQQIGCMVDMRCLRASPSPTSCSRNELMIPANIIRRLTNLEELSFYTTFDFQQGVAVAERLAEELASLEHLNTLTLNFPNVSCLNIFVTQSKALSNMDTSWEAYTFRSFKISIGFHEKRQRADEPDITLAEKRLRYFTNEEFSEQCQEILRQASAFEIIGHDGLTSFTRSNFDLHSVKFCVVERCNQLENIMEGGIASENQGLNNMEKLYLYDLESLKCIWKGPVPSTSLVSLKAITIDGCPKLTKVFGSELARSLQSLQYVKVENCDKVSVIIEAGCGESRNSEQGGLLRSLRKIELTNLPELQSIYASTSRSLQSLMYTSDLSVPPATLAKLTGITIYGCPKLTKVLDSALARSLQGLQYLKVDSCDKISEIIEAGRGEQGELLQSLREVELSNLPLLKSMCESISISCKSLKSITILGCTNIRNLQSLALTNATKLPLIRCEECWWNKLQLTDELREQLLPFRHLEEELSQPRGEASTSRRGSEITEHIMSSNEASTSKVNLAQSRGEASTSGRGSEITEHMTSSNGASTSNMNVAQSRGEALANRSSSEITQHRMLSNATSISNMNGAPPGGESSSTSGSPDFLPGRVYKGCFPTCGCS